MREARPLGLVAISVAWEGRSDAIVGLSFDSMTGEWPITLESR